MVEVRLAPVRPRVVTESGQTLLLEDEARALVEAGATGLIAVLGPPGSGKTTAARHLSALLEGTTRFDVPAASTLGKATGEALVVYAASQPLPGRHVAKFRLAAWERDDLIEYLLAVHKARCASVLARLRDSDLAWLQGNPELWRIVLDELAGDEGLAGARAGLLRYLEGAAGDPFLIDRAGESCLDAFARSGMPPLSLEQLEWKVFPAEFSRILRHRPVQVWLAARWLADEVRRRMPCEYFRSSLPVAVLEEAVGEIGPDPAAREYLHWLLAPQFGDQAAIATLLLRLDPAWVPPEGVTKLRGASLPKANWPRAQLANANLASADLAGANLYAANLSSTCLIGTTFTGADLELARLDDCKAGKATFASASLRKVRAARALFECANFRQARLDEASLKLASFLAADLTGASLRAADLTGATLQTGLVEKADFTNANLSTANLAGIRLRDADWTGARFDQAEMHGCDLEEMFLPHAHFRGANLSSALLTGSRMPFGNFSRADLRNAGLADIEWEHADLRDADLRGASFHLGSSRSGLLDSPIASEGSRTGFYTDDYEEQYYKAPEEMRKANLRGADLRGAAIEGVDFYLVDLRGAQLDAEQVEHVRQCRAILDRC